MTSYKIDRKREIFLTKDKCSIGITTTNVYKDTRTIPTTVETMVETIQLPLDSWKQLLQHVDYLEDEILPRLRQGRHVNFETDLGSGFQLYIRQAYQCIMIRKTNYKIDTRRILIPEGRSWSRLLHFVNILLVEAEKKPPVQTLALPWSNQLDANIPFLEF